jgi:hypothetical protein
MFCVCSSFLSDQTENGRETSSGQQLSWGFYYYQIPNYITDKNLKQKKLKISFLFLSKILFVHSDEITIGKNKRMLVDF